MIWQSRFPNQPYVIAEIGVNHEGSPQRAAMLIRQAAAAGADAVKFQAYKAAKLAVRDSPIYFNQTGEAATTQQEFFARYDTLDPDDYLDLAAVATEEGVDFLCTPFDEEAVAWLYPLVRGYKIASGDITHWPLIHSIAATQKPVILSTGASTWDEIDRAMRWLLEFGTPHLTLLHCMLIYPCPLPLANLGLIQSLQRRFPDCGVGYSDHTLANVDLMLLAAHLGAQVIEKHFTDDPDQEGNDHYHAMTAAHLGEFRERLENDFRPTKAMEALIGRADRAYAIPEEDAARLNARRALVAADAFQPGHILQLGDLVAKRPASGLEPFHLPAMMGRELSRAVEPDEAVTWASLA